MTLVDTSVWIEHFRRRNAGLVQLLEAGEVACHSFVLDELALGSLRQRQAVLALLGDLPPVRVVSDDDVLTLIESRRLFGRGIGWVDAHLLAGALVAGVTLWTLDRRLDEVARDAGVSLRHPPK